MVSGSIGIPLQYFTLFADDAMFLMKAKMLEAMEFIHILNWECGKVGIKYSGK